MGLFDGIAFLFNGSLEDAAEALRVAAELRRQGENTPDAPVAYPGFTAADALVPPSGSVH